MKFTFMEWKIMIPEDYIKDSFKSKLKELRKKKGLNKAQLAKEATLSPSIITQYENGGKTPSIVKAQLLANVLDVTINDLCGLAWVDQANPVVAFITAIRAFKFQVHFTEDNTITLSFPEKIEYSSINETEKIKHYCSMDEIRMFIKEYEVIQAFENANAKSKEIKEMVEKHISFLEEKYKHLPYLPDYEPQKDT